VDKLGAIDLRTPALLLDLDRMNSNLQTMAGYFRRKPVKLRPHFKNHQVLALAERQIQGGAIGMTCARLEHAEALLQQGIQNILVANEIAGESMVRCFVDLSRQAPVMIAVDNWKVVCDMARLAGDRAHELNVVVDLDVGLRRCGISPGGAALALTKTILEKGLRFHGLMGYAGSVRLPAGPEKERVARANLRPLLETKALIEGAGIVVETVTCGGTGDYSITATGPGATEIQAGSYLLMDTGYAPFAPEFHLALSVLTTVVSKTPGSRFVVDAGLKALGFKNDLPSVKGNSKLRVKALHAEHAILDILDPSVAVEVGDKIELWVQYLDPTIQLHERMFGTRNGEVEEVLRIER
jgi:D-serine deaminase-like pyridoxal phosphate-dependent protein